MRVVYEFDAYEIINKANLIGETFMLGSQKHKTGRGKRLYEQMFEPEYREAADRMISRCKRWYSSGLKKKVTLNKEDIIAMGKLVEYCKAL